ncbi:MAG: efflux RND transporter periplasmic adaptor subunit [Planctomycetota bacterium]
MSYRKPILFAFVAALILAGAYYAQPWKQWKEPGQELLYYEVRNADLPIVITERGFLESQEQTSIRSQVEIYDYRSGSRGTIILSIVPNGSLVQKGDTLVELDSASIRDLLESESLELQSDRSVQEQAEARRTNQLTQNETSTAEAKLTLELAKLNLEMYTDEQSGSFKLAESQIDRQIDESRNAILEAQAALKLQETEKDGIEQLFRLGYKGKSDLEQSRYAFMKSEAALASAINQLETHAASKDQLKSYTYRMEVLKLQGEVATAERLLRQVGVTNKSELAQVESQLFEAKERVTRQEARVAQYQRNVNNCMIVAPHDGMVVYAQDERGGSSIAAGIEVRNRQTLLTLPDLSQMQVKIQIHEAVLDQVHPGLPVSIRVEAFSNKVYEGIVEKVAVVPSPSKSSVKTYECIVKIPSEVYRLKPGMNAVAEINVDRVRDVLSLPVQAVVQRDRDTWCYVENANGVNRREIELGRNNDKFVEIANGIEAGERVVLNPLVIANLEDAAGREISPDGSEPQSEMSPTGSEPSRVTKKAAVSEQEIASDPDSPSSAG